MAQTGQVRTYDPVTSVVFLKTKERFGGLSNMAPGLSLRVNGVRIRTSEALYQACRFPHLPDVQRRIIDERSPMTAKMKGKPFRKDSRPDWDSVRVKIMRWCLRVKLAQNWDAFSRLLLTTGDRSIVEQSRKDDFWGAKVAEDGTLVGTNALGRLLMELREHLNADTSKSLKVVEPPPVPEFLLFARPIETVWGDEESSQQSETETDRPPPISAQTDFNPVQPSFFDHQFAEHIDARSGTVVERSRDSLLEPYKSYVESGVPWLGEVPAHWEVLPLKRIGAFSGGTGFPIAAQGRTGDEILFAKVSDMNKFGNDTVIADTTNTVSREIALKLGAKILKKSTIVFPKVGGALLTNKRRMIVRHTCIDNNLMACIVTGANVQFAFRLLRWLDLARMSKPGPVPAISEGEVREIRVGLPPPPEQTAIVRFLDHADRRIRRYIRAKEKLIALLEEQKQAIIHQAVTGRIDVRTGQPYPTYSPSGVEWLGDVPEHWAHCRLRNVVSEVTTGSRGWSSYASDDGPLFIRVANLDRDSLRLRFNDVVRLNLPDTSEASRTRICAGDVLLSVTAYIGSIGVVPDDFEEAYVSQHVARCSPIPGMSSMWLGYVLLSKVGQIHGQVSLYGGTKDGLSLDDVKNYPMLLPPRCEQDRIVRWIERELAVLVDASITAQRQIELFREYRTRLIADVVTGKLDVREAAAALPEVDPLAADDRADDPLDTRAAPTLDDQGLAEVVG